MTYDYAIWKRSETTKTAMLAQAYEAISEGREHPALTTFDKAELERALRAEFGNYDAKKSALFVCEWGDTKDATWVIVQMAFSNAPKVGPRLVPLALALDLLVYDPQQECVWGNKRPGAMQRKMKKKK